MSILFRLTHMTDHNKKLCEALKSMTENELVSVRYEINNLLIKFIDKQKSANSHGEKKSDEPSFLFDSIASRIKSVESFSEKIPRNNYIAKWNIVDSFNDDDYKRVIRENLDDLIGFRINCYFKSKENSAYDAVIHFLEEEGVIITDNGKDSTGEIKKQKNGHIIYKIACEFTASNRKNYKFELQIKSLVHTLWGEVDHEIAYKAQLYDYDYETKNNLLDHVFKTLESSDAQLKKIADFTYTENDLVESLFFFQTKKEIVTELNGKNPVTTYRKFFKTFKKQINEIKKFVSYKLINPNGTEYETATYNASSYSTVFSEFFMDKALNDYLEKDLFLDVIPIIKKLFSFSEENQIYICIAQQIEASIWQGSESQKQLLGEMLESEDSGVELDSDDSRSELQTSYTPSIYREDQKTLNDMIKTSRRIPPDKKDILIKCVEQMCKIFIGG